MKCKCTCKLRRNCQNRLHFQHESSSVTAYHLRNYALYTKNKTTILRSILFYFTMVQNACQYDNREVSQHEYDNDNEHHFVGTCVKVVTPSSVISLASTRISLHFRTFQTNIMLFIFFDLWTELELEL
jgi:hypothetical protein